MISITEQIESKENVNQTDMIVISHDNKLRKTPHYKLGQNVTCNAKYDYGLECFRITTVDKNGNTNVTVFNYPYGNIRQAEAEKTTYTYTGSPIIPILSKVYIANGSSTVIITDPYTLQNSFKIENVNNTMVNDNAKVKVTSVDTAYIGSTILTFKIVRSQQNGQ